MRLFDVIQISADCGIAPGSTKGAAQHLRGVAVGLASVGHHVTTYSTRPAEGPFPGPVQPIRELDRLCSSDMFGVRDCLVYERYSLGHRRGLDTARRLGVPFVLEVNAPLVAEARTHRSDTLGPDDSSIEAELLDAADLVITVSTVLADWVASQRAAPTITIPNGFEPAWFPEPARTSAPNPALVFIGHPKPWHGADRLIDLLVSLARQGRYPELLVIGGGPGADQLRARADGAGVGDRLKITGALPPPDASSLLRRGGIGLAPYRRHDPFYFCPLKVIDYLAAGLPIVATDQGDIAQLVGNAGVVVDPDDDTAFAAVVASLLDDADRRAAMGRSGRAMAMAEMTWHHVGARTAAALHQLHPCERSHT